MKAVVLGLAGLLASAALAGAAAGNAPGLRPWTDYQVIMWVGDSIQKNPAQWPLFRQRLREMGGTAGMVYGEADPVPWVTDGFPYYVENIINRGLCLKFNSKVTNWDAFVTRWKDTRDEASLVRDYCLDDPFWRARSRDIVQRVAVRNRAHAPLLYDLRDELSVTISANPFDYDFNPIALAAFREWLKTKYASLEALNQQWNTRFTNWNEVKPFTTDQIKSRMASGKARPEGKPDWQALQRLKFDPRTAAQEPTRWNFSPWADHRSYMDLSLARALDDFRQTARSFDPRTPVGIEGTQMPHAFGGYDLWRLSKVLDWVEPYDIGNAREIFGSFMPGKVILCTLFEKETNPALRRLWHLLLEGDRGCIVWWSEDCLDWKNPELPLTAKGRALAPIFKEMTSPLAKLFMRAEREYDPIAIHYSQASIQAAWLIESTVDGSTWLRRFSSHEAAHNHQAKVRNAWLKIFQDLGYSPRFLSSAQIELGELVRENYQVFVMPSSHALSDLELKNITAAQSNSPPLALLANDIPGVFDGHGKARSRPGGYLWQQDFQAATRIPASFHKTSRSGDIATYPKDRLEASANLAWAEWAAAGVNLAPPVTAPLETRTRIYRYKLGEARLLAFERGVDYHMSEDLKQAGGNEALEKPVALTAQLEAPAHAYDLRTLKYLGETAKLEFTLDPWRPALFALLPKRIPEAELMVWLLQ